MNGRGRQKSLLIAGGVVGMTVLLLIAVGTEFYSWMHKSMEFNRIASVRTILDKYRSLHGKYPEDSLTAEGMVSWRANILNDVRKSSYSSLENLVKASEFPLQPGSRMPQMYGSDFLSVFRVLIDGRPSWEDGGGDKGRAIAVYIGSSKCASTEWVSTVDIHLRDGKVHLACGSCEMPNSIMGDDIHVLRMNGDIEYYQHIDQSDYVGVLMGFRRTQ